MTAFQEASINLGCALYYSHFAAFPELVPADGNVIEFESLSGLGRTTWIDLAQRVLNEARAVSSPKVIARISPDAPWGIWQGDSVA